MCVPVFGEGVCLDKIKRMFVSLSLLLNELSVCFCFCSVPFYSSFNYLCDFVILRNLTIFFAKTFFSSFLSSSSPQKNKPKKKFGLCSKNFRSRLFVLFFDLSVCFTLWLSQSLFVFLLSSSSFLFIQSWPWTESSEKKFLLGIAFSSD